MNCVKSRSEGGGVRLTPQVLFFFFNPSRVTEKMTRLFIPSSRVLIRPRAATIIAQLMDLLSIFGTPSQALIFRDESNMRCNNFKCHLPHFGQVLVLQNTQCKQQTERHSVVLAQSYFVMAQFFFGTASLHSIFSLEIAINNRVTQFTVHTTIFMAVYVPKGCFGRVQSQGPYYINPSRLCKNISQELTGFKQASEAFPRRFATESSLQGYVKFFFFFWFRELNAVCNILVIYSVRNH